MKKVFVHMIILFFVFLIPTVGLSQTETLTLKDEKYKDGKIIKYFEKEDGSPFTFGIAIPFEYRMKIENSNDKVLEAKKQLTTIYLNLGLKARQKELDNIQLYGLQKYKLKIDFDYKMTFKHHQRKAYEYAKREHEEFKKLSSKKRKELYDTSKNAYMDYEKVIKESKKTLQNGDLYPTKEATNDKTDGKVNNEKDLKLTFTHVLISVLIIFLFVIVIFILRKR